MRAARDEPEEAEAMRSFYESNLALIHNAGFGALARGAGRVVVDRLRQSAEPESTLIDLGCGSGILAEQVSAAGYRVVGVDLSSHLLTLARQRAPQARFVLGSMYEVELPPAAAVTMIGECINYLVDGRPDVEDLSALFHRVHAALQPGGFVLFDAAAPGRVSDGPQKTFTQMSEWSVLIESRETGHGQLAREITTFRRVGDLYRREDETHTLRLWAPHLVEGLLTEAGFEVERFDRYDDVALPPGLLGYVGRKRPDGS
jgi:SAM-dependent methyltransferase